MQEITNKINIYCRKNVKIECVTELLFYKFKKKNENKIKFMMDIVGNCNKIEKIWKIT